MIVVYLGLAVAALAVIGTWGGSSNQDSTRREDFIARCTSAAADVGAFLSRRHCACAWDELRDHYSPEEIMLHATAGMGPEFQRRFTIAFIDCE